MSQNIVMRPIQWLHISDIHMRVSDTWSHDVVLKAMCDHVARQCADGIKADFILATGDLAFSGKVSEYRLTARFFDALSTASEVVRERIFCIPGNHDVDRERQQMCFLGARKYLQNQNRIDLLLSPGEDLKTLLKREENFRHFQTSYFTAQDRTQTVDGLGYVSCISIDNVRIAIVGLDSAWLAEGGVEDLGKLLIGERQVINALDLANTLDPHIVIGMAHHPIHLLREFDCRPVQSRIERACRFFHSGHLHEPEAAITGCNMGCLTLSAGASFETRHSHNTYSLVTIDLLHALQTVQIFQYNPSNGTFSFSYSQDYRIELPAVTCSVGELAHAMKTHYGALAPWAHYLSALLLDQKAELLIPAQNGHIFGSFSVLQSMPDTDLKRKTAEFMAFRNVLRVFYKHISLPDIFVQHGAAVGRYGDALQELCCMDSTLEARLAAQEGDAKMLASTEPHEGFSNTRALLEELAAAQEWALLREHAQRHVDSLDPAAAIHAKRMLALGLAHSDEATDKETAIELYRSLSGDESTEFTDVGNLVTLLIDADGFDEAKAVVLDGIVKFPAKADYYSEMGQRIVEATGDRLFRQQMETALTERGKGD